MIRWLHISDLHFNNDDMSTVSMREELPKYLRKNNIRCDYIFCTGDIRTANASPNNFSDEAAQYLIDLCTVVGITADRLFTGFPKLKNPYNQHISSDLLIHIQPFHFKVFN